MKTPLVPALLGFARIAALGAGLGAGCGGTHGKLVVDTPARPYEKPDISEITGIEEPDTDAEPASGSAAEPAK